MTEAEAIILETLTSKLGLASSGQSLRRRTEPAMAATLGRWAIDANPYVVSVTRGHKHDGRALGAVLDSPARYVGMIGSRRKIEVIYRALANAGAKPEQLERVHAPIGLAIGAVNPDNPCEVCDPTKDKKGWSG